MTELDLLVECITHAKCKLEEIRENEVILFGYRERMLLEKPLFLLLSHFCKWKLSYDVKGFNDYYRNKILELIRNNDLPSSYREIILNLFSLKSFLQKISNENAYVRGDALSGVGIKKGEIMKFITIQLTGLEKRLMRIQ